ncbi:hypothetical protein [Kineococcus sp. SYSU DK006]|uniref:hypothetical protein n=1 Tax=Kineococcus sp. SYSU DK006 TaxID=3383127 RepID=UPI003D7C9379
MTDEPSTPFGWDPNAEEVFECLTTMRTHATLATEQPYRWEAPYPAFDREVSDIVHDPAYAGGSMCWVGDAVSAILVCDALHHLGSGAERLWDLAEQSFVIITSRSLS